MKSVLILAGAVASLVLAAPASAAPLTCNGSAALCDRPYDQVVAAGAHNAMSARADGFSVPNQQVGIAAQLRDGIRAFLVDTYAARRTGGKLKTVTGTVRKADRLYLCHVDCANGATPLERPLRQMADFIRRNPGTIVTIVNEDHVPARNFIAAVKASPLARYLYRGKTTGPWPTLRQMASSRQQVVMLAENRAAGAPWYHRAYAGIVQETPYSWPDEGVLTDPARQPQSCVANRGQTVGSLFLMNHWSPPFGANEAASARVNDRAAIVSRARTCALQRAKMPTIVAVDMTRSGDVVGAVRELNGV